MERYDFQKYPKTLEDFDEVKGVEFHEGRLGKSVIQKLVIFSSVLVIETRSGTSESKELLEEMLLWGKDKLGLNYQPGMFKRFAYISDVSFYSDAPVLMPSPSMAKLAKATSERISEIWQESIVYDGAQISLGYDPLSRRNPIAPFTIQRRAESRFSENKYFSEAPLPTEEHIKLLEMFEAEVKHAWGIA